MTDAAKKPIVVVDDDRSTWRLIQRQLELAGYQVAAFDNARASLDAICAMGSGIVIADWNMPDMDGLELRRAVRELEEMQAVQSVYFILLSARTDKERIIQGLEAGANDYLTKPYHAGELLARIQVGERMLRLQDELLRRNIEVQKANAQMALLAHKLDEQANTDGLTGLPNRRALFERLEEVWKQCQRQHQPLSCVMLDVDHFKRVNDTYGHAAGDQVLKAVAQTIRRTVRRPELSGRFGGEEFVLLCPATPFKDALQLAERVRQSIAAERIVCDEAQVNVTVSCGVAEHTSAVPSPDALVQRADAMLYAAKEHGRNQTWYIDVDGNGHSADAETAKSCASSGTN